MVPLICESPTYQPISFCRANIDHLYDLDLADLSDSSSCASVDILIGSDLYWDLVMGESRRGTSGPVAIKTVFGWVLSGPVKCGPPDESSTCLVTHILRVDGLSQNMQILDDQLKAFWELNHSESLRSIALSMTSLKTLFASSMVAMKWSYLGRSLTQLCMNTITLVYLDSVGCSSVFDMIPRSCGSMTPPFKTNSIKELWNWLIPQMTLKRFTTSHIMLS